ncbi:unnamed protein product [Chondrus crispus]|uniref:SSD domain-containing protein n=1 Tax=Chondrus crispus TaxID=2769 RepID=R7Q6L5_CHOCR|nr:unnamed protein product [Chondrus crispus]CDF32996.1 unnamed protein product [Chondrus crispus]|eukprot:XP_005712799.1 unnamed protein product [Chondrus crispus]
MATPHLPPEPPTASKPEPELELEPAAPRRGALFRLSASIDGAMRAFFFRLGYWVAANPFKTVLFSLLVVAATLAGMLRFRSESRAAELWVPQGTVALKNQAYVEQRYGQTVRASTIAFVQKEGGASLATRDAFLQMLDVASAGYYLVADPINDEEGADGTPITYEERCLETKDAAGNVICRTNSVFNLFYDVDNVVKLENGRVDFFATVRVRIESLSDAEIKRVLDDPPPVNFDDSPFNADEIIGKENGAVRILMYTQLANNKQIVEGGELIDKEAEKLEENWTVLLLEGTPLLNGRVLDWYVESLWSQGDSLAEALTGDLPMLAIGFVLLGVYIVLFLGDFHAVRSHMLLALGAIATTGLALGACFGISSALGMFFGPVHQILPLLIVGIGIDDCFHVTRAVDEVNQKESNHGKSVQQKIALALSQSGTAITVTSFTNVVVFLLSAISKLPALRFFSLWAAVGIFAAWGFAVTFYTALVTFDLRRQDAKRRDCCPCFPPVQEVKELNWFKKPAGGFSRFFGNTFGPLITRPIVRIVLLVLFVAGLAACSYGASQLYLKFEFAFFYPSGSAQREYQDQIDKYFKLGSPTNIYVRDRDLSTRENQLSLLELCKSDGVIAKNEWIQGDTLDCWYNAFRNENGVEGDDAVVDPQTFADRVARFLEDPLYSRYSSSILLKDEKVEGCKFSVQYIFLDTNDDEISSLESVREAADSVGFGNAVDEAPAAFPYIFFDTFSEQYAALPGEIGISLGLASLAVAIVCLVLIGHPLVALISVVVVGIIIIDVLGLTYFSGINLSSVSVITLVLCTGIGVDFVVHIARSFLEQVGTRTERTIKALETMGPPVFYAGFSTFLAIIVLSGARSYIFQVIFKGFLFLIIMGFLHGLILCPILLSLVGPASFYADEADKENAERVLEERIVGRQGAADEKLERRDEATEEESV